MRLPYRLAVWATFAATSATGGCAAATPAPAVAAPMPSAAAMSAEGARVTLRHYIDSLIDVPDFRSAQWGVLVVDPGTGETLYTRNADKLFMPASNMKLLTGATALAQLGPDFRWRTAVFADGPVRDGVLAGNLIVRGTGDPSASSHARSGDALAPLRAMADSLRARGVMRVSGHVLAAPSPFTDAPLGYGWSWDDLDEPYSAGVDALYFNEGFTEVIVRGGAQADAPVSATTRPATTYPALIVRARTIAPLRGGATAADSSAARGISVGQDSARGGVVVSGTIAAGDSMVLTITFRDQSRAYLAAFREALASRGIVVEGGGPMESRGQNDSLFVMWSPTLRDILPLFEKPSQNQIGELLFKTLALEKTGVGRADSASQVVARQLIAWGAEADGFAVRDGSGLSRHDYLTPRTVVKVLDAMRRHPEFRAFYDALPIAGVDGTVRGRMKDTPAMGNLRAKTGTLDKARALSGYVTTADGRLLMFSALCNNYSVPTRRVDRVTDALGVRLATLRLAR